MHIIPCPESIHALEMLEIKAVKSPEIRQLIQVRCLQNELNKEANEGFIISSFLVVEANDPMQSVEQEICSALRRIKTEGKPIDEVFTPTFEWIFEHPTCYEAAFIHCDREYGVCVLIPKESDIDPDLLEPVSYTHLRAHET